MIDDEIEYRSHNKYDGMICTSTHVKRYADEQIKNLSDILILPLHPSSFQQKHVFLSH